MIANKTADMVRIDRERREEIAARRASSLREGLDLYAYDNYVMRRYVDANDKLHNMAIMTCENHSAAVAVMLAYGKEST